jgi:transposase-like protein
MRAGVHIDYKTLRKLNPEAARRAVLEYLASCEHNVAETARAFGLTRATVYAICAKSEKGTSPTGPRDRCVSRGRHRQSWKKR